MEKGNAALERCRVGDGGEVVTGAEGTTRPLQDDTSNRVIGCDRIQVLAKYHEGTGSQSVQFVGPVEGKGCQAIGVGSED